MFEHSKKAVVLSLISVVTVASFAAAVLMFSLNHSSDTFESKADQKYSIVLNETNAQSVSGTSDKYTGLGNKVQFLYSNVQGLDGFHTKINENGSIKNISQLTSITSFEATFEGNAKYRISLDNVSWSDYSSITSGTPIAFDNNPYYLEFSSTDSEGVRLLNATYQFSCRARPTDDIEAYKSQAITDIQEAFNELDIEDYNKTRWQKIVNKLNTSIESIKVCDNQNDIDTLRYDAISFFENSPKAADIVKGTLFDYQSSSSNYTYDLDDEGHLLICYDGYPGHWVYTGTKTNLHTDISLNNKFSLTLRNNISETIEVCLQLTDASSSYKVDSGILKVNALETKTITLTYSTEVTRLYLFVDSCHEHSRVGEIAILGYELSYDESIEPTQIYDPKGVSINQEIALAGETITNTYTITDDDHPTYIGRVDAVVKVNLNGNGSGSRWFGLHLYAASAHLSPKDSDGSSVETTDYILYRFNFEISSSKKLSSSSTIYMDISYAASGLTFEVLEYKFYYTLWKDKATETIEVNTPIYIDGSGKDADDQHYTATIPYSSFTKKGRVSKVEISFTSINSATYVKSQIHISGVTFTEFDTGNNNVLNIAPIMEKSNPNQVTGTISVYPTSSINLESSGEISIVCWWASASYICVNSVTLYTDIN